MKYYDPKNKRLYFTGPAATCCYWDKQWKEDNDIVKLLKTGGGDNLVRSITPKFIQPSPQAKVIDAGCGKGQHVVSLKNLGYSSYGVDYAPKTISLIKKIRPDLKVSCADITDLPFPNAYFDGYWSLGVIEHFYSGFEPAAKEMARVVKPNGYLFLVFPHMSSLRKTKSALSFYHTFDPQIHDAAHFYQFALHDKDVIKTMSQYGFRLISKKKNNGLKGLKDESAFLKPLLQQLYDHPSPPIKATKVILSKLLTPLTSHTVVLVMKKQDNNYA